jgi:hypothetical protein
MEPDPDPGGPETNVNTGADNIFKEKFDIKVKGEKQEL